MKKNIKHILSESPLLESEVQDIETKALEISSLEPKIEDMDIENLKLENILLNLEYFSTSFDYLRITVASPQRIKNWAERRLPSGLIIGEILTPEGLEGDTHEIIEGGLFCQKIFGPIADWRCKCGRYSGFICNKICEMCEVEIIEARVRRYRMGFIELIAPLAHCWYLKGTPSYLCVLLRCFNENLKVSHIEEILYFKKSPIAMDLLNPLNEFICPEARDLTFFKAHLGDLTSESEVLMKKAIIERRLQPELYAIDTGRTGANILKSALEAIDIHTEILNARTNLKNYFSCTLNGFCSPEKSIAYRIRILESFLISGINPTWLILTNIPVIPPSLRPSTYVEGSELLSADINELYSAIILRNGYVMHLLSEPTTLNVNLHQALKFLQESVDALIDNSKRPPHKRVKVNDVTLQGLAESLEGKPGRFRHSILGKRVDYSGRSVILVGPNLRLNQCALPYEIAVALFEPLLIAKFKTLDPQLSGKEIQELILTRVPLIWRVLSLLMNEHSILLNRAPTLHRFGVQAFDPILHLGLGIKLHPLVCAGFNADFDGDQMAVHLPLYKSSQLEAKMLMRSSFNIVTPSNDDVILKPAQDMVIGCYYLTLMIKQRTSFTKKWFAHENEALLAFYQKKIELHSPILVRYFIFDSKIKIIGKAIFLLNNLLEFEKKQIIITKLFTFISYAIKKYFVLTNIGLLIFEEDSRKNLHLIDFFLETTPGRLIFSMSIKKESKEHYGVY